MSALQALVVYLHVVSVAAWLGAGLWVAGDIRRALALGPPHAGALAATIRPKLGLDAAAAVATFVTGLLVMSAESMTRPRLGIMAGIVFAIARGGVLAALRRAWRGVAARLAAGEAVSPADPAARRMSMLAGIAHTLWLLALAGMIFPV